MNNKKFGPGVLTITTIERTNRAFLVDINVKLPEYRHYAAAIDIKDSETASHYIEVRNLPMSRAFHSIIWIKKFTGNLISMIQNYDINIVHVHTPVAAFLVRLALRSEALRKSLKVKVVYTAHGFHFYDGAPLHKNLLYINLEKFAGKWTDHLIVINQQDYHNAIRYKIVPREKISFIPGIGIDIARQDHDMEEPPLFSNEQYFLCVAEFIPRKRQADIIKALASTAGTHKVYFAGDGHQLCRIKTLAHDYGVHNRVRFLGHRSDIGRLMRHALGILQVSSQEGLPRSVLEAMAHKKVVIGTRIRGTEDLLSGGAGILVNVGDTDAIADAMVDLNRYPLKYKQIAEEAYRRVEKYRLEHVVQMQEGIYQKIIKEIYE